MKQIIVAAGIVYGPEGQVLLAQRPPKSHQEGWWEFPGGKLEAGETPHVALDRELQEELGIRVLASRPFMTIRHRYEDREVTLLVREVLRYQGEPRGAEGQEIAWVKAQNLPQWRVLPADAPVIRALMLPHQYLITPDLEPGDHATLMRGVQAALARGLPMIQLRLPRWSTEDYAAAAKVVVDEVHSAGGQLLINRDWRLAQELGAAGVHLSATQLNELTERPVGLSVVAASTHNLDELNRAQALDCDFVCLSPVRRTPTHPEAKALNWQGLAELVAQSNLPIFALGGVRLEDFDQAREAGAVGVAGIRGFWL